MNRREALISIAAAPLLPGSSNGNSQKDKSDYWCSLIQDRLADRLHRSVDSTYPYGVAWAASLYAKAGVWFGRFGTVCLVQRSKWQPHPYSKRAMLRMEGAVAGFAFDFLQSKRPMPKGGCWCSDLLQTSSGKLLRIAYFTMPLADVVPGGHRIVDLHDNHQTGWWAGG